MDKKHLLRFSFFLTLFIACSLNIFAQESLYKIALNDDSLLYSEQIVYEAFKRNNLTASFSINPHDESLLYAASNLADGLISIPADVSSIKNDFVQVAEPVEELDFIVLSTDKNKHITSLNELNEKKTVYLSSKKYLKNILTANNAYPIPCESESEAYDLLINQKTDFVILTRNKKQRQKMFPKDIFQIGTCNGIKTYLYLSKKNESLAEPLSKTLKILKIDSTYDRILSGTNKPGKNILFINSESFITKDNQICTSFFSDYCIQNNIQDYLILDLNISTEKRDNFAYDKIITNNTSAQMNETISSMQELSVLSAIFNYYTSSMPAVVIANGEYAASLLNKHYNNLFEDVPVIICGILDTSPLNFSSIANNGYILYEHISAKETIDQIFSLFPDTTQIYAINDTDAFGRNWRDSIKKQAEEKSDSLKFNENLNYEKITEYLSQNKKNTVVLMGRITQNINNQAFNLSTLEKYCVQNRIPIFGLVYDENFKYHICGDYIVHENNLIKALNIADAVLDETPLPIAALLVKNPTENTWIYNYETMHYFFSHPLSKFSAKNVIIKNKPKEISKSTIFKSISVSLLIVILIVLSYFLICCKRILFSAEKKNIEEANTHELLSIINETSNRLSLFDGKKDTTSCISNILEFLSKKAEMELSCLCKLNMDSNAIIPQCTLLANWHASNIPDLIAESEEHIITIDSFIPDWNKKTEYLEPIIFTQDNSRGMIKYQMAASGILTRIIFPINHHNVFWGFASFENRHHEIHFSTEKIQTYHSCIRLLSSYFIETTSENFLKEAKDAAQAGTTAKSTFLANMSHEVRTPLNAIMGMSDLLLMDKQLTPIARDYAQSISVSSRNLLGIINDILDFTKIESGKLELTPAPYDFISMINDVLSFLRLKTTDTFLQIFIRIAPDIPCQLIGDSIRIKQILINLLTNAIKYTKEGSISLTISGSLSSEAVELTIEVQDTGIGIKPEEQSKIFTMFERLDTKRNRNIEGTGLGLAITKQLCELMDGSITFHSEYGNGTTFTAKIKQTIVSSDPIVKPETISAKNILVYEPRRKNRKFMILQLADIGIRPDIATAQQDFMQKLEHANQIDYIFVSSIYYTRIRTILQTEKKKIKIAVIDETGIDYSSDKNTFSLIAPVYCVQLAQILSNRKQFSKGQLIITADKPVFSPNDKVLVVDDNKVNLKVATGLLNSYGIQSAIATSGFDALEILQQETFSLIFMDHLMPEMDGIEAAHEIKKLNNNNRNTPIIALTANAVTGMKEKFLEEGFSGFLPKPIDKNHFLEILTTWLPFQVEQDIKTEIPATGTEQQPATQTESSETSSLDIHIDDLDIQTGLDYAGGSEETYLDILKTYTQDTQSKIEIIKDALDKNDLKTFTIHVHAIKSASRCIGALQLGNFAEQLERAGNEKDIAFITSNIQNFYEILNKLTIQLKNYFTEKETEPSIENSKPEGSLQLLDEQIQKIKHSAENFDAISIQDALVTLECYSWEASVQHSIDVISEASSSYKYEDILAYINRISSI